MRSVFAIVLLVIASCLESLVSANIDATPLRDTNRRLGRKGLWPFAGPWAGIPDGLLSNFVDRGISRCARKKPTHEKFVDCVEKFCFRNIGGRVDGLTEQHCKSIQDKAMASDVRKPADVAIQDDAGLKITKPLRVDIIKCGILAETRQSHKVFIKCLNKALEKAVSRDQINEQVASKIRESGRTSTIGTFGTPKEGSQGGSNGSPTGKPTSPPSPIPEDGDDDTVGDDKSTDDETNDDADYVDDTSMSSPLPVPPTLSPVQIVPPSSAPVQAAPPTSAPVQIVPPTSAPVQAAPPTSAPVQEQPQSSAPVATPTDGSDDYYDDDGTDDAYGDDANDDSARRRNS